MICNVEVKIVIEKLCCTALLSASVAPKVNEKVPLRDAPVGYYFEVVTQGYGGMPDYAMQVSPEDRWKIIAYIRALQWSQSVRLEELPEKERQAALKLIVSRQAIARPFARRDPPARRCTWRN